MIAQDTQLFCMLFTNHKGASSSLIEGEFLVCIVQTINAAILENKQWYYSFITDVYNNIQEM